MTKPNIRTDIIINIYKTRGYSIEYSTLKSTNTSIVEPLFIIYTVITFYLYTLYTCIV